MKHVSAALGGTEEGFITWELGLAMKSKHAYLCQLPWGCLWNPWQWEPALAWLTFIVVLFSHALNTFWVVQLFTAMLHGKGWIRYQRVTNAHSTAHILEYMGSPFLVFNENNAFIFEEDLFNSKQYRMFKRRKILKEHGLGIKLHCQRPFFLTFCNWKIKVFSH